MNVSGGILFCLHCLIYDTIMVFSILVGTVIGLPCTSGNCPWGTIVHVELVCDNMQVTGVYLHFNTVYRMVFHHQMISEYSTVQYIGWFPITLCYLHLIAVFLALRSSGNGIEDHVLSTGCRRRRLSVCVCVQIFQNRTTSTSLELGVSSFQGVLVYPRAKNCWDQIFNFGPRLGIRGPKLPQN